MLLYLKISVDFRFILCYIIFQLNKERLFMNKFVLFGAWVVTATAITTAAVVGYNTVVGSSTKEETYQIPLPAPLIKSSGYVEPKMPNTTVKKIKTSVRSAVYFDNEVTGLTVNVAISLLKEALKHSDKVYLVLNSPGGSVFDGVELISFLEENKISTICVAICASMAAQLHQAGAQRLMTASGVLMFHPASAQLAGPLEQMQGLLDLFKTQVDRLDLKISKRSGIPYAEFKRRLAFQYWVLPEDAFMEHLTDEIVSLDTGDSEQPYGVSVTATAIKRQKNNVMIEPSESVAKKYKIQLIN